MSNELYHHGVKGQRWGIRRYQNEDGSYTDLGNRRRRQQLTKEGKKNFRETGKISDEDTTFNLHNEVANDYRQIQNMSFSSAGIARNAKNIEQTRRRIKSENAKRSIDVSKMSTKELQDYINRANLERQYRSIKAEEASSGKDYVSEILDTVGDVVTIAGGIAGILVAIHTLKQ